METRWSMLLPKVAASVSQDGEDSCKRDDGCAYTTLRKTICSLETDASGKPVQKCEKTEQLLRKCAGRPAEVVDSKVEESEEDASHSHRTFSLDYDSSEGNRNATPFQWHERRLGPGEDAASREYPFRGLFEKRGSTYPGSLEEFVQNVFGAPLEFSEVEKAVPPTGAPEAAEHLFGWFKRGPLGSSKKTPANDAASCDQSKSKQDVANLYESLARGVQEV